MRLPTLVVAFSGGADSTAMALRLAETGERFTLLTTLTGNELPEVREHIARVVERTGAPHVQPPAPTLASLIEGQGALPAHHARWCTRMIKIVPCIAYLKAHHGSTLAVGLRHDEPEREGLYGPYATYRYPLREWKMGRRAVLDFCASRGVVVPPRTDCAVCYDQRLIEWFELWRDRPEAWAQGEAWETLTGHTFRSPGRDTWPAALRDLRARFERGDVPRDTRVRSNRQLPILDEDDDTESRCRVCHG